MLAETLLVAVVVAAIYLAVVRFLDMNESEPWWAIALLFGAGVVLACVLHLVVPSTVLELTVFPSAAAEEGARFVAIGSGIGVLTWIGRRRGLSEINGVADGIVYGAAGGLGFGLGELVAGVLTGSDPAWGHPGLSPSFLDRLMRAALDGMSDGVFGALVGAALVAALYARGAGRVVWPLGGLAGAFVFHVAHAELRHGNALGGAEGYARAWAARVLPLVIVVALGTGAILSERRAIRERLADEAASGAATAEEVELLLAVVRRHALYARTLLRSGLAGFAALGALHNRQVQLAMAKGRAAKGDLAAAAEVGKLRAAVLVARRDWERAAGTVQAAGRAGDA
jgi:hypothetical protein